MNINPQKINQVVLKDKNNQIIGNVKLGAIELITNHDKSQTLIIRESKS